MNGFVELAARHGARAALRAALMGAGSVLAASAALAQSLSGGTVVAGSAQIGATVAGQTTISQTSAKAVIDWRSFGIAAGEAVRFVQPDRAAIALNRVTGSAASQIDGALTANGQVWLLNPNGVLIGGSGRVSAAGFLATTRSLGDADFLAGRYNFTGTSGAGISNAGSISASDGYAVLAGSKVANSGMIEADLGQVVLAAGKSFALDLAGDKLISFAVTDPLELLEGGTAVDNSGTLRADGGRVLLTARSAASVVNKVINTSGVVQARSAKLVNGEIVLDGGEAGRVQVGGTLDASGLGAGETGGRVVAIGDTLVVGDGARLDARGDTGGGEVLVGGGWQGASALAGSKSAVRVAVLAGATLDASAVTSGKGGTVVAWSDVANSGSQTYAFGTFLAMGGGSDGGGRIETSGHYLSASLAQGSAGVGGTWLFDPYDIRICTPGAGCATEDSGGFFQDGGFQHFDQNGLNGNPSIIFTSSIETRLNGGMNVLISTGTNENGAGAGQGDIIVDGAIAKTNGTAAVLNLVADRDVIVNASIGSTADELTLAFAGQRAVIINSTAGTLSTNGGDVDFLGGQGNTPMMGEGVFNAANIVTAGGNLFFQVSAPNTMGPYRVIENTGTISTGVPGVTNGAVYFGGTNNAAPDYLNINNAGSITTGGGSVTFKAGSGSGSPTMVTNAALIDTRDALFVNGTVTITGGNLSRVINDAQGEIRTTNGAVQLLAGNDGGALNSNVITTLAGSVTLQAGDAVDIATVEARNTGQIDTSGGVVTLQVGSGTTAGGLKVPIASNTSTINTTNGGGSANVSLLGGNLSVVWNEATGAISSGGGAITLQADTDSRSFNQGSLTSTSGLVRMQVGNGISGDMNVVPIVENFVGGTITTGTGSITLSVGSDQYEGQGPAGVFLNNFGNITSSGAVQLLTGGRATLTQGSAVSISGTGSFYTEVGENSLATLGGTITTQGGSIEFDAGGNSTPGLNITGALDSNGGGIAITGNEGGLSFLLTGQVISDGGSIDIDTSGGGNGPLSIGDGVVATAALDAGSGDISLKSDSTLSLSGAVTGANVRLASNDIAVTADSGVKRNRITATNTITIQPIDSETSISIGGGGTLDISAELLDRSRAATIKIGYGSEGYGDISVGPVATATNAIGAFTNQTRILYNGDANNIVFSGNPITVAAGDTLRVIGGNITIGSGTYPDIFGKAEFIALQTFTQQNGFLNAQGAGQWLIYTPNPADVNLTGTPDISGQAPIWGVNVEDAIDGLLSYSGNRYAFSRSPSVRFNPGDPHKTYGDAKIFTAADVQTSSIDQDTVQSGPNMGLVDASVYGNIFEQDSFNAVAPIASSGAAAMASVGQYSITVNAAYLPDGYGFSLINGTLTIDPRLLTVTLRSGLTKVYDKSGNITLASGDYIVSNLVNGDQTTINQTNGTISGSNVGTYSVTAGLSPGNYNFTVGTASNYTLDPSATGTASITPKALTISATADSKVYDGTRTSAATPGSNGLVGGDSLSATQMFDSIHVGAGNLTRVTSFNVSDGNGGNNYTVTSSATATGNITPRPLLVRAVTASKTYDGTTAASGTPTVDGPMANSGLVIADQVTSVSQAFASRNALGTNGSLLQVTGVTVNDGNGGNNYAVQTVTAAGTINTRALTVSAVTDTKVYDGTTTSIASPTVSGLVSGDSAAPTQAFMIPDAGNGIVMVVTANNISDGNNGLNYSVTQNTANGTINRRQLTGSYNGTISRPFNGLGDNNASVNPGDYQLGNFVMGQGGSVTTVAGNYDMANNGRAGTNIVVNIFSPSVSFNQGTNSNNYFIPSTIQTTGAITPVGATINLTGSFTKIYDGNTSLAVTPANFFLQTGYTGLDVTLVSPSFATLSSAGQGGGKTVTLSGFSLTGTDAGNFFISNPMPTNNFGFVQQRTLVVALQGNTSKVYDKTTSIPLTNANVSLGNFVAGEGATLNATTATLASPNVGSGVAVNASLFRSSFTANQGTDLLNYVLQGSQFSGNIGTVTQRALTVSLGAISKIYDGTTAATLAGGSITGVISGDTVTLNPGAAGTFDTVNVGASKAVTFTSLSLSGAQAGNYALPTFTTQSVGTITARPVTLTLASASKVYDGTTTAPVSSIGLSNIVAADQPNLAAAAASASFDTRDAGTGKTVTYDGVTLTGSAASNYSLSGRTVSTQNGTITVRPLTATLTGSATKVYDGSAIAPLDRLAIALGNAVSGDSVGASIGNAAFANANAADSKLVTASGLSLVGTAAANYSLGTTTSLSGQVGSISPKQLTVALGGTATKVYDATTVATLGASNFTVSGFVGNDGITFKDGILGKYASADAGTGIAVSIDLQKTDVTATGTTNLDNYNGPDTLTGSIGTITPKALTAALTGNVSKVYTGTTTATLTAANVVLSGFVTGQSAALNGAPAGTYASANVGTGLAVTATLGAQALTAATGTRLANYAVPASATGNIGAITPATLTYTATAASRAAQTANPAFTGTVGGFVASETQASATAGTLTFASLATTASAAGSYAITGSGLTAQNYVFTQAAGNATALTVTPVTTNSAIVAPPATQAAAETAIRPSTIVAVVSTPTPPPPPPPPPAPPAQQQSSTSGDGQQQQQQQDGQGNNQAPAANPQGGSGNTPTAVQTASNNAPPPAADPPPPPPPPPTNQVAVAPQGGPVAPLPDSPVSDTKPATPPDAADQGDPVLAAAAGGDSSSDQGGPAVTSQVRLVAPGVSVDTSTARGAFQSSVNDALNTPRYSITEFSPS